MPGLGTHPILPPPATPWTAPDGGFRAVYTRVAGGRVRMFSADGGSAEILESNTEFISGDVQFRASSYIEIRDRGDSGFVTSTDSIVTGSENLLVSGSFSVKPFDIYLEQPSCLNPDGSSDCVPATPNAFDTATFGSPYQLILPRLYGGGTPPSS